MNAALDLHNVSLFLAECHHVSWFMFVYVCLFLSTFFVSPAASLIRGSLCFVLLNPCPPNSLKSLVLSTFNV